MRTFKRAKYSSKDSILEQKRFECTFSKMMLGKGSNKENLENQKSCFQTNGTILNDMN